MRLGSRQGLRGRKKPPSGGPAVEISSSYLLGTAKARALFLQQRCCWASRAYRREVTGRVTELRSSGDRRDTQLRWLQNSGLSSEAVRLEVGTLLTFCSGSSFPVGEQDELGDYSHSSQRESGAQRGPRTQKAGRP